MSTINNLYHHLSTKSLREHGYNLYTLGNALSKITEPFEITASLHSDELSKGFISVTNIYDYGFSRISDLRDDLNAIARTYSKELREFVFNHTHKYIATMITGGIEDVAVVIAPERKINNQKGE